MRRSKISIETNDFSLTRTLREPETDYYLLLLYNNPHPIDEYFLYTTVLKTELLGFISTSSTLFLTLYFIREVKNSLQIL